MRVGTGTLIPNYSPLNLAKLRNMTKVHVIGVQYSCYRTVYPPADLTATRALR